MKLHAWIAKQGWFEVAYVVDYFYKAGDPRQSANVVLFDGSAVCVYTDVQLFYNLQGE